MADSSLVRGHTHEVPAGATALDDLDDVDLTGLTDDQVMVYDLATGLWKPETLVDPAQPDASTTTKGITKLSTAPASPTDPIAAGDNDPRLSDARTPTAHNLVSPLHVVSGLTAGHVLRALSASSFGFGAIQDADLPTDVMRLSRHEIATGNKTFRGAVVLQSASGGYPQFILNGSIPSLTAESGWPGLFVYVYSSNTGHAPYHMYLRGLGTATAPLPIAGSGVNIGLFGFRGYNAGNGGSVPPAMSNQDGARIWVISEGPFTNTSQPMRMSFWTAPTGAFSALERYRITSAGRHWFGRMVDPGDVIVTVQTLAATDIGHIVRGFTAQSANLAEWQSVNGTTVYMTVSENGFLTIRKIAAPADGELVASEVALWYDSSNTLPKLMWKGKKADGTVASGALPALSGVATEFLTGTGVWAAPSTGAHIHDAADIPFTSLVGLPQDDVAEALDGIFNYVVAQDNALDTRLDTAETEIDALQAEDIALDGRLDALEAVDNATQAELDDAIGRTLWTGADLPTTGNYEGRRVYATNLTNTTFRDKEYVYRNGAWRLTAPFDVVLPGGAGADSALGVEADVISHATGILPCECRIRAQGDIQFGITSTPGTAAASIRASGAAAASFAPAERLATGNSNFIASVTVPLRAATVAAGSSVTLALRNRIFAGTGIRYNTGTNSDWRPVLRVTYGPA